jgi:hypothetical protein
MIPTLMQIGIRNYLIKKGNVLVISRDQLTIHETFLSHLLDKQQWFSFGWKLSIVMMEVLVSAD